MNSWFDKESLCNRCGLCCVLPSGKDCPNLQRNADGLTSCKIYAKKNRIGTYLGEGVYCHDIMKVKQLFPGCPYNIFKNHSPPGQDDENP